MGHVARGWVTASLLIGLAAIGLSSGVRAQSDGGEGWSSNLCGANRATVWIEDDDRAASYLDQLDVQWSRGPWLVGGRLEFDEETRLDPESFSGIRRRFAEYRGSLAMLRAGTFYATFGRGLLLRAEEDEIVRLDRDIDGVRGAVNWRSVNAQAVMGRPRNDETHLREDLLSGLELRMSLPAGFTLGGGYVRRDASREAGTSQAGLDDLRLGEPVEELAGGSVEWSRGIVSGLVEGARRHVWGIRDPREGWIGADQDPGHALYGAFTLSLPGYAWLVEGKDYTRFDAPYSTLPPANSAGQPVNDGRDEHGVGLSLTANRDDMIYETAWSWAEANDEPGQRLSAEASARRDWWGRGSLRVFGEWVRERELESHALREYAGPRVDASYYITPETSLELHSRFYQWTNEVRGSERQFYNEASIDLSLSLGYSRGATLSVIHATDPVAEFDYQDTWVALELAWNFSENHDLKVKLGEERGGIVCSGGVCHYEPPFTGVRAELISRL